MSERVCGVCGHPMLESDGPFHYHGSTRPCPEPPLKKPAPPEPPPAPGQWPKEWHKAAYDGFQRAQYQSNPALIEEAILDALSRIGALQDKPQAPQGGEEWRCVPVEPTEVMVEAGRKAMEPEKFVSHARVLWVWEAMVKAALHSPAPWDREKVARIINEVANKQFNAWMIDKDASFTIADALIQAAKEGRLR